jgi:hypothetical protein
MSCAITIRPRSIAKVRNQDRCHGRNRFCRDWLFGEHRTFASKSQEVEEAHVHDVRHSSDSQKF